MMFAAENRKGIKIEIDQKGLWLNYAENKFVFGSNALEIHKTFL